jgi:hypothetical protein
MKTPETLNTECVDIFLRFPINICMPHSDKPSNGYDHWKTAQGEIFYGDLKKDWVFEYGRRFGSRIEPRQQIEQKEDALQLFLIGLQVEARTRNTGVADSPRR